MFQEIPVNDEHVIAFKAVGKLTHDDYQTFLPQLESAITKAGSVSLLLELEDFHGWELEAALDDYRFGKDYMKNIKRLAIVGDRHWGRWLVIFARPFSDAEVRYFDRNQQAEAWDWLGKPFVPPQPVVSPELTVWQHVLHPTDFSLHAENALQRAVEIARRYRARLTLLHAVEESVIYDEFYNPMAGGIGYPLVDTELTQIQMRSAQQRLEKLAAGSGLSEVKIEVALGSPRDAIIDFAEAHQVDVVVMGSHGHRGLARLLGSSTHAVLSGARCDVLSVPLLA